ncbi:MAG: hypothetical protein LUC17_01980 [Oscillospiraceae bacterium]|nr:hypothetical protein [Oscillospiraceae bacterium]
MSTKRILHYKPKICEECGKPFIPKSGTQRVCDGTHTTKCIYCGKDIEYTCRPWEKPNYCSKECIELDKKRKLMEKYRVDNVSKLPSVKEKISKANSSEAVQAKRKQTCIERYGVENPFQSEEIKEKIKETNLKNYGVENPMQNPEIADKISKILSDPKHVEAHRQHLYEKYGVYDTNDIPGVKEKTIKTNMEKYGVPYYVLTDAYRKPEISVAISKINKYHAELLKSLGFETEFEKTIENKSFDIFLPSKNVLIEIDPTYTHNSFGNHWNKDGLNKDYHFNKTTVAMNHGYRCIHIWDWDLPIKVYSSLLDSNKISVNLCVVKPISEEELIKFSTEYSIYRNNKCHTYNYGLYYNDECLSVMTFEKSKDETYDYVLMWYCTKFDYSIDGGYLKIFNYFIQTVKPKSVISYCDRSKFDDKILEELGFCLIETRPPVKHWSNFQTQILDDMLQNTNSNNWMLENGWLPVYDCGQLVYIWKK